MCSSISPYRIIYRKQRLNFQPHLEIWLRKTSSFQILQRILFLIGSSWMDQRISQLTKNALRLNQEKLSTSLLNSNRESLTQFTVKLFSRIRKKEMSKLLLWSLNSYRMCIPEILWKNTLSPRNCTSQLLSN